MKLFRKKTGVEVRDEIRAKASKRFSTISTVNLIPMCERQLADAWQAFDRFQDHPEPVTVEEFGKQVSALQAIVDVLEQRFDTKS